ncbi:hypothetical protein [Blastopirellula marina]|uniref:Uncharacterized protein n=1 Tax=Blastopirellula marina TaxID=124 RepID=A0A2S8FCW3_9BACT|nr:hypothetical protein [Blastopirellula marina]PQO29997.1 hypothetical protein C5Y98_22320 [Blastopirellula marina]PTL42466.1 hypothetical protein C5Y97_22330 [Blastopirellula marina]
MNLLCQLLILAADEPVDFTAMGEHFRADNQSINIPHMIVLALAVLVVSSLIWALTRWQEDDAEKSTENPQRLFDDLCKQHDLGGTATKLLRKVSRELQLANPASLFVDPGLLASAGQLEKFQETGTELTKVGEELFGYHLWKQAVATDRSRM